MHAFTTTCTSASPSNWYCMILLKISSKKNTKWWLVAFENRNQGVEKACNSSTTEFCSATSQTRGRAGVKAMDLAFQRTGYKNVHWLRKTPDWPLHTSPVRYPCLNASLEHYISVFETQLKVQCLWSRACQTEEHYKKILATYMYMRHLVSC